MPSLLKARIKVLLFLLTLLVGNDLWWGRRRVRRLVGTDNFYIDYIYCIIYSTDRGLERHHDQTSCHHGELGEVLRLGAGRCRQSFQDRVVIFLTHCLFTNMALTECQRSHVRNLVAGLVVLIRRAPPFVS